MIYILREIWIQSGPTNGRETSVYFLIFIKILKSGKEEEAVPFFAGVWQKIVHWVID